MNDRIVENVKFLTENNPDYSFEVLVSQVKGFASARNDLLKRARGDYVFGFDSDSVLLSNPLPRLTDMLKRDEKIVGVTPRIEIQTYDWITRFAELFFELPYRGYDEREAFGRFFDCGFYKKVPLIEIGGFDERFNEGKEGLDLAIRLWEKGYKIIWTRKVQGKHIVKSEEHFPKIKEYATTRRLLQEKYSQFRYKNVVRKKGNIISQALWIAHPSRKYVFLLPLYYFLRKRSFQLGVKQGLGFYDQRHYCELER